MSYPATKKLVKDYVEAWISYKTLSQDQLDLIASTYVSEDDDLSNLYSEELQKAIANLIRNPKNTFACLNVGKAVLETTKKVFPKNQYLEIQEMFEDAEQDFKPQASNDDAIELALFNRDMAGFVNATVARNY